MRLESIPSVLMSPEFLDRIRTDINLNQIQHKSRRKKAERFARAMVSVALDSLQHFKSTNFYLRTVEAPSSKLTQLVGQNSTREFFAVLAACQWKVDHSYSTGIGNTNKESKKIGIPVAVHRRMLEFLQEQGEQWSSKLESCRDIMRCQEKSSWIWSLSSSSGALCSLVSGMLFSPITEKKPETP